MHDHHLQLLEYMVFIQTTFGPLDLGSSQKNITAPRQLEFFSQQNSIDAVIENMSITPAYFIQL